MIDSVPSNSKQTLMTNQCRITLIDRQKQFYVNAGSTLLESLINNMVFVRNDCGGKGVCGKCVVKVQNASLPDETEGQLFDAEELAHGNRLACRLIVDRDLNLEIPTTSLVISEIVSKPALKLPPSYTPYTPEDCSERFGVAVDLGTTTIGMYLCNLDSMTLLMSTALRNPQALFGDDVINRISAISSNAENLTRMQSLAVRTIEYELNQLLLNSSTEPERLEEILVVGNSTMIHIFAGVSPRSIGHFPYNPEFLRKDPFPATSIGFRVADGVMVRLLPLLSGFLGSDIVSAGLAVELNQAPVGTILVDIGTNGELLLKGRDAIYATSCATGPAFEGAALSCGMPAVAGAIDVVKIKDNRSAPVVSFLPHPSGKIIKPSGICGSGFLSGVAELCRTGIVSPDGRFSQLKGIIPGLEENRESKLQYVLVSKEKSENGRAVKISQKDIRAIQLAKSALATGISLLCQKANMEAPVRIILAGAFGNYLDPADAVAIGMLPDIGLDRIELAGNSAGAGAVLALTDSAWLSRADQFATEVTVVNLAEEPRFQEYFINGLAFPSNGETD